jgi:hypothetical protein
MKITYKESNHLVYQDIQSFRIKHNSSIYITVKSISLTRPANRRLAINRALIAYTDDKSKVFEFTGNDIIHIYRNFIF